MQNLFSGENINKRHINICDCELLFELLFSFSAKEFASITETQTIRVSILFSASQEIYWISDKSARPVKYLPYTGNWFQKSNMRKRNEILGSFVMMRCIRRCFAESQKPDIFSAGRWQRYYRRHCFASSTW